MYHTIKFASECLVDLEMSSRQPLERVLIRPGTGLRAQLRPYVLETNDGPIEVADLFFEDDTAIRSVPFACFSRQIKQFAKKTSISGHSRLA